MPRPDSVVVDHRASGNHDFSAGSDAEVKDVHVPTALVRFVLDRSAATAARNITDRRHRSRVGPGHRAGRPNDHPHQLIRSEIAPTISPGSRDDVTVAGFREHRRMTEGAVRVPSTRVTRPIETKHSGTSPKGQERGSQASDLADLGSDRQVPSQTVRPPANLTRVGTGRALLDGAHRGRAWEPFEGSHFNRRPFPFAPDLLCSECTAWFRVSPPGA